MSTVASPLRRINKTLYDTSLKCLRLGWYTRQLGAKNNNLNMMTEHLFREGLQFERYVYKHKFGYKNTKENEDEDSKKYSCNSNDSSIDDAATATVLNMASSSAALPEQASARTYQHMTMINRKEASTNNEYNSIVGVPDTTKTERILLQPTFIYKNYIARPDAMQRIEFSNTDTDDTADTAHAHAHADMDYWEIYEIKSCTDKSYKKKISDLAFSVYIARKSLKKKKNNNNIVISKASLIVVNSKYVSTNHENENENNNLLYKCIDCTDLVNTYIRDHDLEWNLQRIDDETNNNTTTAAISNNVSSKPKPPPIQYKLECGKCELFDTVCYTNTNNNTNNNKNKNNNNKSSSLMLQYGIWKLPRLTSKKFQTIYELLNNNDNNNNYTPSKNNNNVDITNTNVRLEISDIPIDNDNDAKNNDDDAKTSLSLLTKNQKRYWNSVVKNSLIVDDKIQLIRYLKLIEEGGKEIEQDGNNKDNYNNSNSNDDVINNDNNNNNNGRSVTDADVPDHERSNNNNAVVIRYLDFEAVSMIVPPYNGMVPYETMVTQYSIHTYTNNNSNHDNSDDNANTTSITTPSAWNKSVCSSATANDAFNSNDDKTNSVITKYDLIAKVASIHNDKDITIEKTEQIVNTIIDTIRTHSSVGGVVRLSGFGTFFDSCMVSSKSKSKSSSKVRILPSSSKEQQQQQQRNNIRFKPYKAFCDKMKNLDSNTTTTTASNHKNNGDAPNNEYDEELFLSHSEYLADPSQDCRKEMLETLLQDLGYRITTTTTATHNNNNNNNDVMDIGVGDVDCIIGGSIVVYSSYEKVQLEKLAILFPQYKKEINDIIHNRLIDLEKIVKECISHPKFYGRSSIKVVLPALCPDFEQSYEKLLLKQQQNPTTTTTIAASPIVTDGGAAIAAFSDMITSCKSYNQYNSGGGNVDDNDTRRKEIKAIRTTLLEYCKLDTLALFKIHQALKTMV